MGYRLTFCETDTGIVLNADGTRALSDNLWQPTFEAKEDAIALKDKLLEEFIFGECNIKNLKTEEYERYWDEQRAPIYFRERQEFWNYQNLSWWKRRKTPMPTFQYFDPNKQLQSMNKD